MLDFFLFQFKIFLMSTDKLAFESRLGRDLRVQADNVVLLDTGYHPQPLHEWLNEFFAEFNNQHLEAAQSLVSDIESLLPADLLPDGGLAEILQVDINQQVAILEALEQASVSVADVLRLAQLCGKATKNSFKQSNERSLDHDHKYVLPGHRVEMLVEVPRNGGLSRAVSNFGRRVMKDIEAGTATDAGAAVLADELEWPDEVLGALEEQTLATAEDFKKRIGYEFETQAVSGIVAMAVDNGVLTVLREPDGEAIELEGRSIKLLNVVGAETDCLLDRGPEELYYGRRVRVWLNEAWQLGRISFMGLGWGVGVRLDSGGQSTVGRKSESLDLMADPEAPPKRHTLEDYPDLRNYRCVRVATTKFPFSDYGFIDGIDSNHKNYAVHFARKGKQIMDFDDPDVAFVPLGTVCPRRPEIKVGNKIRYFDFKAQTSRIYEILGYDDNYCQIITEIVSQRPSEIPICHVFPLNRPGLEIADKNYDDLIARFPVLSEWKRFAKTFIIQFEDENGQMQEGRLDSLETLPFHVEVLMKEGGDGSKTRFEDVAPERIKTIWNTFVKD